MSRISRPLIPFNYDDDTDKSSLCLSTGWTVAVQCEFSGLWMQGMVVEHGSEDNSGRSYKIRVIKTRYIIDTIKINFFDSLNIRLAEKNWKEDGLNPTSLPILMVLIS